MSNDNSHDPVNYTLRQSDMDAERFPAFLNKLTDVPSSFPLNRLPINKAGIVNQSAYVRIPSLFNDEDISILCDISMFVGLSSHRGIHMSRCEEALTALTVSTHSSLNQFAEDLAHDLLKRQKSDQAQVSITGTYLAKRTTKVSKQESFDRMYLHADAEVSLSNATQRVGLSAYNITGCPCTRTYTKYSVIPKLTELGFSFDQIGKILDATVSGTHTQRGLAKLTLEKTDESISHRSIYDVLDTSCHLVYELLKRPDEHDLVIRALRRTQFTEDVARDIASTALERFSTAPDQTEIFASSHLYDSIHIHDVYTEISRSLGELRASL